MKTIFNYVGLLLITTVMGFAQSHQILKKSVEVDRLSKVNLNVENIYLAIEESTDGKVHFDYTIEFDGYSKKAIKEKLNGLNTEVITEDLNVTLNAKSLGQISFQGFVLTSGHGLYMEDDFMRKRSDSVMRKSKDSLLKEIRKNNQKNWPKDPLKFINGKFKKIDKDGNLSNIRKGNVSIMRSRFVIKIPPFVKLHIVSKNAGIYFKSDIQNELSGSSKLGNFKAKSLNNRYNSYELDNVHFEAESIIGGSFDFKNLNNSKIGSIAQSKITSEFSKIEIGEIGEKTIINDFNSEYWLYNWVQDFSKVLLTTEYSKINLFFPQQKDYHIATFGHDTVHFYAGVSTTVAPSRENKSTQMMSFGSSSNPNKLQINAIHGIVRFGDDFIEIKR